jgi:DNA polymerase III delta subunit
MLSALKLNGPFAFKLNGLLEAAARWSDPELGRALAALERADGRLKSGSEPRSTLASAVLTACGGDGRERVRSAGRTGR